MCCQKFKGNSTSSHAQPTLGMPGKTLTQAISLTPVILCLFLVGLEQELIEAHQFSLSMRYKDLRQSCMGTTTVIVLTVVMFQMQPICISK